MRDLLITEHVHALRIPFKISIGSEALDRFVYTFIVTGKEVCLIDTGVSGSEKLILEYLRSIRRRPEEISMVIQTHSHPDHIGATSAIKEVTGCIVASHPAERAWIEDVSIQARERPVPGFQTLVGGSVDVDRQLNEGDKMRLDDLELEVYHTPGHSKGSISLFLAQEGVLFSGDAVPVSQDLPIYEDVMASVRSIEKLKRVKGVKALLSAWDQPRGGEEAYKAMDDGLQYLQKVHTAVLQIVDNEPDLDPLEISRRVLQGLGIKSPSNPLFVRSILSNLAYLDQKELI